MTAMNETPLDFLLADPLVTEIIVNSFDCIWYEKFGKLNMHEQQFESQLIYDNFIDWLTIEAKIQINSEQLFANGHWRSFRVHLCHGDTNGKSHLLALRRLQPQSWSLGTLAEKRFCSSASLDTLRSLVSTKKNVLIVGGTGSGKTTVLNALLNEIQPDERCVLLEDTNELVIPNRASTKILTRPALRNILEEITLADLLKQSLRMRPDRLIIGEVRGGEAKDLMMALATGHAGSMGTLHAATAQEALLRLEFLVQTGAPQWSSEMIRRLIHLSLQAVIVVGKNQNGERVLKNIIQIAGLEETGFLLESLQQSQELTSCRLPENSLLNPQHLR